MRHPQSIAFIIGTWRAAAVTPFPFSLFPVPFSLFPLPSYPTPLRPFLLRHPIPHADLGEDVAGLVGVGLDLSADAGHVDAEDLVVGAGGGAPQLAEHGLIGQHPPGVLAQQGDNEDTDRYTTPEEAVAFQTATGVDALAVAIGTAHGVYKSKPQLNLERLRAIRAATDTPLVLHGGSGLSDDDFRNTIRDGVAKVNIHTDMTIAGAIAMRDGLAKFADRAPLTMDYLEVRNLRVAYIRKCIEEKIRLFGSAGKA